ncbi:MAG: hypothetical protein GQ564_18830 [Bacteroidales bacterium]|nr:hypothetical protein [Bacteroidales bacterium]
MVWNKYSIKLFVFLVSLCLTGLGFFWSLFSSQLIITNIVFLAAFISGFLFLLKYLNKTNQDLNQFLSSIQYLDNVPSKKHTDLSHGQLNLTYHKIIDQLKDVWIAKESERQYFEFVLEQIGIGILSFNNQGEIEIYNRAASEIFGIRNLKNIKELEIIKKDFAEELTDLKSNQDKLLNFNGKLEQLKVLVRAVDLKIKDKSVRLISLQNIKTQLEESELEAWQKLIRVLTHEIMNSVTPIKSLTYSMQKSLSSNPEMNKDNILKGLSAIENRSKGLLEFVESYKNLTQIPKPNYERVQIIDLFQNIKSLFEEDFELDNIAFNQRITSSDISLIADEKLLSQVIINLIKNSIYALEGQMKKSIELIAEITDKERVCIRVVDNGKGIPEEVIDKIFVPFYTTRENGSGIGLSFARQVMVMHNGNIQVQSLPNIKTEFSLFF